MKQTKADLLIEIGKLTQLVEEIRDRLTRLEARAPYTPYRPWPYYPTWSSSGTYKAINNGITWDRVDLCKPNPGTVTEGRFRKDGSFEAELKA